MSVRRKHLAAIGALLALPASADHIGVPAIGQHPGQEKRAIVYTQSQGGTFAVKNNAGQAVFTGVLQQPRDAAGGIVPCQGGQPCVIADYSGLRTIGTYRVEALGMRSAPIRMDRNVFGRHAWKFLEFFEAHKQQGSDYHADLHKAEKPPFTFMVDGSYVATTRMLAATAVRLANAYMVNPTLWRSDRHGRVNVPDMPETLRLLIDQIAAYQDEDGTLAMPGGHVYDFTCAPDYDPALPRYNRKPDPCLRFDRSTSQTNTLDALVAYASALPIIHDVEGKKASQRLLNRALRTKEYALSRYGAPAGQDAAALGTALFMLADVTGEQRYLREAHGLRASVPTQLSPIETHWNESYWDGYARHKDALVAAGLQYPHNGTDAEQILANHIRRAWNGGKHPISGYGERAYIHDENWGFHHSRFMLIQGIIAAKARQYANDPILTTVANAQLQWLTGMNSVQDEHGNPGPRSFIAGIGSHRRNQHTRLVYPTFFDKGMTFLNGRTSILGLTSGALDFPSDPDTILNAPDDWGAWMSTESTSEIVSAAMELLAYQDAHYNGRGRLLR